MLFIVISMTVIVAVAGLVVAFVAFPHRGEELPGAAWLGQTMGRAAGAMPTLREDVTAHDQSGAHPAFGEESDAHR